MQEKQIPNKLRAARELGLDIIEEYKEIEGNNYNVVSIKKNGTLIDSFAQPLNKPLALQQLEEQKNTFTVAIEDIENKITQINALK